MPYQFLHPPEYLVNKRNMLHFGDSFKNSAT